MGQFLFSFLGEILGEILGGLVEGIAGAFIPERARDRMLGVLLVIVGVGFLALGCLDAYSAVKAHESLLGPGIPILIMFVVSAVCVGLARRCFRAP